MRLLTQGDTLKQTNVVARLLLTRMSLVGEVI